MPYRRKVVGTTEIIEERIIKESRTKNSLKQTIVREVRNAILLDCGHKLPMTQFKKVPTNNTNCLKCKREEHERERAQRKANALLCGGGTPSGE